MRQIIDQHSVRAWNYWSAKLGRGFVANDKTHLCQQIQELYIARDIPFREQEIQAEVDDWMCGNLLPEGSCRDRMEGLGDLVQFLVKPVARISDALFDTNLMTCSACNQRRQSLNEMVPFK